MKITEKRLIELFPQTKGYTSIFYNEPKNDTDLLHNYLSSKLWRLNNLYTIVDKWGNKIPFKMNESQFIVKSRSLKHPRLLILKSRQQGISTFWLLDYLDDALFMENMNIGLMSQGLKESGTLLKRVKTAIDNFPQGILDLLGVKQTTDNSGEIGFSNGSTIYISTSFRSATLHRLHISEYGKICNSYPERAAETKTGTLQAIHTSNTVIIESTAEGDNDFATMWWSAINNTQLSPKSYNPVFLSWINDSNCVSDFDVIPTKDEQDKLDEVIQNIVLAGLSKELTKEQKNFWIDQYRELGDKIYQEYPSTPEEAFRKIREGTYYAKLYFEHIVKDGKLRDNLYDYMLPVQYVVDLGMNDDTAIIFFQVFNNEIRIIGEYLMNGEGLEHYINYIKGLNYNISSEWYPHDVNVKELGSGKTRLSILRGLGVRPKIVPKSGTKGSVATGIELVRNMIPKLYIDKRCEHVQKAMLNYAKEFDEKRGVFRDIPKHDQYSHMADALRYLAMVVKPTKESIEHIGTQTNKRSRRNHSGFAV
jgi:hypothetical protein